jgi:O-antigen/teichoic acid export membrane protein
VGSFPLRIHLSMLSDGALAVIDQAVISAGNFGTSVILARALDQASFGVFVLAMAVPLIILQIQYGLLMNPLVVNGAAMDQATFGRFARANAWLQVGFTSITCAVLAIVVIIWEPLQAVAVPLLLLTGLWQIQEFCRRVLYTRGLIRSALFNNFVNYDAQVIVIALAYWLGNISLTGALWVAVATSAAAIVLGAWQLRPLIGSTAMDVLVAARESFAVGKWTASAAALVAAGHQSTPFFVTLVDGLPSAAALGVMYQLIGPVHLLGRPIQNYFTPMAIRALADHGAAGLERLVRQTILITGPAYFAYTLVLALLPAQFLTILYAGKYTDFADELRIFAIMQLIAFAELVQILELSARRMQKHIFLGFALFTGVLYSVGWYLTAQSGVRGLIWALTAATCVQVVFYAIVVLRARWAAREAGIERLITRAS